MWLFLASGFALAVLCIVLRCAEVGRTHRAAIELILGRPDSPAGLALGQHSVAA